MEDRLSLVVGLGNPGQKYSKTRHNIGFEVIDGLVRHWNGPPFQQKFHAETVQVPVSGHKVLLMKPQTFMNRSGLSVGEAVSFFKIPQERVLIVYDDLDLPTGALRIRPFGGSGGHNGLKSIIEVLGHQAFPRVRLGIGRAPDSTAVVQVLGKIPKADEAVLDEAVQKAVHAIDTWVREGIDKSMNTFNQKKETQNVRE